LNERHGPKPLSLWELDLLDIAPGRPKKNRERKRKASPALFLAFNPPLPGFDNKILRVIGTIHAIQHLGSVLSGTEEEEAEEES
jgi:hypothetical protein